MVSRPFIVSSLQQFSMSGKRNLRNYDPSAPSASLPVLPKRSQQRGCATRCFCAESSGVSHAAKEGEAPVKLPDARLRYFLLYQPGRFWRKVANSWRQRLLTFPLTFLLLFQTQLLTPREMAALRQKLPKEAQQHKTIARQPAPTAIPKAGTAAWTPLRIEGEKDIKEAFDSSLVRMMCLNSRE